MEENTSTQNKIKLSEIPINSCKMHKIKGKKFAICHEANGEFKLYELDPVGFKKKTESGAEE